VTGATAAAPVDDPVAGATELLLDPVVLSVVVPELDAGTRVASVGALVVDVGATAVGSVEVPVVPALAAVADAASVAVLDVGVLEVVAVPEVVVSADVVARPDVVEVSAVEVAGVVDELGVLDPSSPELSQAARLDGVTTAPLSEVR
jgi:hypothetical protein